MFLNRQLWAIYHMALKRENIRMLLLDQDDFKASELNYKFIVMSTNPMMFLKNLDWMEEIDEVEHVEREHSFYQNSKIFFNSCVIFKTGWSCQFTFIEKNEQTIFLKQSNRLVFIDRDQLVKSEQIRFEALKNDQWHDLPEETELEEMMIDFYELVLRLCHLHKKSLKDNSLLKQNELLVRPIIYLLQWLNFLGECFSEDQFKQIDELTNLPIKRGEEISIEAILLHLKAMDELVLRYLACMNYQLVSGKLNLLKDYIDYLINQEINVAKSNNLEIFRAN